MHEPFLERVLMVQMGHMPQIIIGIFDNSKLNTQLIETLKKQFHIHYGLFFVFFTKLTPLQPNAVHITLQALVLKLVWQHPSAPEQICWTLPVSWMNQKKGMQSCCLLIHTIVSPSTSLSERVTDRKREREIVIFQNLKNARSTLLNLEQKVKLP